MAKYFAMIEGRRQGPFELSQLPDAGVTPDTYVWCRGMEDWEKAAKVADICRFYRQRLSGTLPVENITGERPSDSNPISRLSDAEVSPKLGDIMREVNRLYLEQEEERRNPTTAPRVSLALAIASTLICFPPTGFVAIYQCVRASNLWKSAPEGEEGREQRVAAHDAARLARMWTGITLCFGLIAWAAISHFS